MTDFITTKLYAEIEDLKEKVAELETKVNIMEVLAEERRQFIVNGVELGYISLPDCEVDSANDTFARCNLENEYALNNFKLEQQAKGVEALAYSMLFRGHLENTLDRCEVLDRANEIREQAKQLKEQPNV